MSLQLDAASIERLIHAGMPAAQRGALAVEEVRRGYARIRLPFSERMLRPGGVVSGPALFTAADSAMYVLVLAHLGAQMMAVTSDLSIRFLNKAAPGDVIAEARLLRLGRRLVTMEAALFTGSLDHGMVAHATGSYALPIGSPSGGGSNNPV